MYSKLTVKASMVYDNSCMLLRHFCKKRPFLRLPGPEVIKLFSCSTQLSMKFFLLINVKMPTIVGILTFVNRKNNILGLSESEKKLNFLIFFILMSIQNFMLN